MCIMSKSQDFSLKNRLVETSLLPDTMVIMLWLKQDKFLATVTLLLFYYKAAAGLILF